MYIKRQVAFDTYTAHASSGVKWLGPVSSNLPSPMWHATVAGDPTSRQVLLL
jgi:hypothetical protein